MQGRVKFFSKEKGYGFIIGTDSENYFYHSREVRDIRLAEYGDEVEFEVAQGAKGPKAVNVKVVNKAATPAPQERVVRVIHERGRTAGVIPYEGWMRGR